MNGTNHGWLRTTLLTLGLALAAASVGCVGAPDELDIDDAEDDAAIAVQELGDGDYGEPPPPPQNDEEAVNLPSVSEAVGNDDDGSGGEPVPVPWRAQIMADPLPDDIDPLNPVSNAPASGHSGK